MVPAAAPVESGLAVTLIPKVKSLASFSTDFNSLLAQKGFKLPAVPDKALTGEDEEQIDEEIIDVV